MTEYIEATHILKIWQNHTQHVNTGSGSSEAVKTRPAFAVYVNYDNKLILITIK